MRHPVYTDSPPTDASDAYYEWAMEMIDDGSLREQDAFFEAAERQAEELDHLGLDSYSRRACEPGARRGLLR